MDCLVLPVSMFRKCYTGANSNSRLGYRQLTEDGFGEFDHGPVTVVVGKERREFLVDPFVLEETPFRFLLETAKRDHIFISSSFNNYELKGGGKILGRHHHRDRDRDRDEKIKIRSSSSSSPSSSSAVIYVDVDAMLFEHMLWLMYNDCSSLFKLNLEEIIDFYTQDNC